MSYTSSSKHLLEHTLSRSHDLQLQSQLPKLDTCSKLASPLELTDFDGPVFRYQQANYLSIEFFLFAPLKSVQLTLLI
jgi:hypothetical protein